MATTAQIRAFIELLGGLAVAECNNRIAAGKGFVLPSVCIAQSALETGYGTAGLMTKANAFFGIKAGGSWTGAVYSASTWEVANGEAYNTSANFRAYGSLAESVTDYYDLIGNASRYSNALSYGKDKSQWKTARACITAIWSGGYATDTLYVQKVMNIIDSRDLTKYDDLVTGTGSLATPGSTSIIFYRDDLVQGRLVTADSGRSIAINTTFKDCIALDWEKAIDVKVGGTYFVTGVPDGATFYYCHTDATSAYVDDNYLNGEPITLAANTRVGFYLRFAADTPVEDLAPLEIGFTTGLPAGTENYSGVLAYFVAIE